MSISELDHLTEVPIESDQGEFRRGWPVMLAGFLLVLILYGTYYCFGVFLKPMLEDLGWTRAMTTGALSVYMVVHGALAIVMGSLSDKHGPRWIVALSTILVAIGYGLLSQISEPWHLYLYFGIMVGIGMGAGYVPPISTVTRWFTHRRGLAVGIVAAGVGVGQMLLPPLAGYLITTDLGWRGSFVVMGVLIGALGIPAAFLLRNPQNDVDCVAQNEPGSENSDDWQVRKAIRTLPFALMLGIFIALTYGVGTVVTHLAAHMNDSGIDPVPAAVAITLIGGSGIFGRIIIGGAADRVGHRTMLAICLIPQMMALLWLIWAQQLWEFYLIATLFGFVYGGTLTVIIKINSEFFGVKSGGAIFGVLLFGATVGGATAAPLAGYIHDVTHEYQIAFLIAGLVMVIASIFGFLVRPPSQAVLDGTQNGKSSCD